MAYGHPTTIGSSLWPSPNSCYFQITVYCSWLYVILVGGIPSPLKNIFVRQLGWWHSQYDGKIIKVMVQTTNQWLNMINHDMNIINDVFFLTGEMFMVHHVHTHDPIVQRIPWNNHSHLPNASPSSPGKTHHHVDVSVQLVINHRLSGCPMDCPMISIHKWCQFCWPDPSFGKGTGEMTTYDKNPPKYDLKKSVELLKHIPFNQSICPPSFMKNGT